VIGGGSSLIHAYAMAHDMRAAVACFEEMEAEGILPNAATVSVIISGYAKLGNVEYVILPPMPLNSPISEMCLKQFSCSMCE